MQLKIKYLKAYNTNISQCFIATTLYGKREKYFK